MEIILKRLKPIQKFNEPDLLASADLELHFDTNTWLLIRGFQVKDMGHGKLKVFAPSRSWRDPKGVLIHFKVIDMPAELTQQISKVVLGEYAAMIRKGESDGNEAN